MILSLKGTKKLEYSFKETECRLGMAKGSTNSLASNCPVFLYERIFSDSSLFCLSTSTCGCLYLYVQGPAGKDGAPGLPGAVGVKV